MDAKQPDTNILVVEEQILLRAMMREAVRAAGIGRVVLAKDRNEALQYVSDGAVEIGLVIYDWHTAEAEGLDFLREVRKRQPKLPVLMLSCHADRQHVKMAAESGASAFIAKPFSPSQLQAKVRLLASRMAPAPAAAMA